VLELLAKNKFLAVPVKDKDKILGIATLLDIFSGLFLDKSLQEKGDKVTKEELVATFEQNGKQTIDSTIFSTESVNFLMFDERDTLGKVLESFSAGYHRLLVTSVFNPSAIRILTQSDVIAYLKATIGKLGASAKLKAGDVMKSDAKKVVTALSTQTAISAFHTLAARSLHAAPVVNGSGALVGTLSISDLRGLTAEEVPNLLLPVAEFLKKVHGGKSQSHVTIKKSETLEEIIPLVAKTRVHRVWVLDDDDKIHGVLSLTDIITAIFLDKSAQ